MTVQEARKIVKDNLDALIVSSYVTLAPELIEATLLLWYNSESEIKKEEFSWVPVVSPENELPKDKMLWVTINDPALGPKVKEVFYDKYWSEDITHVVAYMVKEVPDPWEYDRSSEVSKYHWIENPSGSLTCEKCGAPFSSDHKDQLYFCPCCGTRLKVGKHPKYF